MAGTDPAALGDPEDILNYILGFALGAKGSGGAIDQAVRLKSIERPGGAPWIQHQQQADKLTGGWIPGKEEGKIVFWRKMKGMHVEWVHIGVAGDNPPSLNKPDAGATAGTLGTITAAWTALVTEVPGFVGPGKALDYQSIHDTAIMFEGAARYFDLQFNAMKAEIEQLDLNAATFRGSASESYVQRVGIAQVKVGGARAAAEKWRKAFTDSSIAANAFSNDLRNRIGNLYTAEGGRLLNPQNYVHRLFNAATLTTTFTGGMAGGAPKGSPVNTGNDLGIGGIAGAIPNSELLNQMSQTPTMMISFPGIEGGPWDVFVPAVWPEIDARMRASWAKKVREIFLSPIAIQDPVDKGKEIKSSSFGGSAAALIDSFNTAAALLVPPPIGANPKVKRPPPPVPGAFTMGGGNYNPNFPDYNPNFPEYNPNFPEYNPNMPEFGGSSDFAGNSDLPPPFDLGGNTSIGGGIGGDGGPAPTLGGLSPDQLGALQDSGALDDIPLTEDQLAALDAAGMPAPPGSTLGSLSPAQLALLQKKGLLDDVKLTDAQRDALGLDQTGTQLPALDLANTPDPDFGANLPTSQFPTTIDGLEVTPTGSSGGGVPLGDVTKPLSHSFLGGSAGVGGGGLPVSGGAGLGSLSGQTGGLGGTAGGPGLAGAEAYPGRGSGQNAFMAGGSVSPVSTGGMPFMPPMGGMGGGGAGAQEKARERKTWLTEDEDVWGTDPECGPAVIGRDDVEVPEPVESPTMPMLPRPIRPGRAQPRRQQP